MTSSKQFSYDVFVSYSRHDKAWVHDWLWPRLEQMQLSVCYDEGGSSQDPYDIAMIDQAIRTSLKTLIILTPRWLESIAQFHEIVARHSDPANMKTKPIIPLVLEPCHLPPRIDMLTEVDFTDPAEREAQLRRIIAKILQEKEQLPPESWPTARDPNGPPQPPRPIRAKSLFRPGQIIGQDGRYEIIHKLGQGGFGTTYLALDRRLQKKCVVKRITNSAKSNNEQNIDDWHYFKQEIDILKTLSQSLKEGIPRILDEIKEHNSFVMEYIDGDNFENILNDNGGRPLPLPAALECVQKICEILVSVHEHQPMILHRDIKPANILRGKDGRIWLIDFGLGKLQSREYGATLSSPALGTFLYMAPEQRNGQAAERSDVYSLSATLYALVTGGSHSLKDSASPLLAQSINPLVPSTLDTLIAEGMSQDVEKRPHARVFLSRLRLIMASLSGRPPITTPNTEQVSNRHELAQWGQKHWELAADWMYRTLPQDLRHTWSENGLAEKLMDIKDKHPSDRDAALDEALSLIDPEHFDKQPRGIFVEAQQLEFEVSSLTTLPIRTLTISNTGKRYIRARIERPDWLETEKPTISLLPGQKETITFAVRRRYRPRRRKTRDSITIRYGVIVLARINVLLKQPLIKHTYLVAVIGVCVVLLVGGLWILGHQ